MNWRHMRWAVLGAVLLLTAYSPATLALVPTPVSLYSVWLRLSLRGFSQEEIESLNRNMDPALIDQVKSRLRRTVLSNLELKQVRQRFRESRDKDDLRNVLTSIGTEIRFAGLNNDPELKTLIKEQFGIDLAQF